MVFCSCFSLSIAAVLPSLYLLPSSGQLRKAFGECHLNICLEETRIVCQIKPFEYPIQLLLFSKPYKPVYCTPVQYTDNLKNDKIKKLLITFTQMHDLAQIDTAKKKCIKSE